MKNLLKNFDIKKFFSAFLIFALLAQFGIFMPLEVRASTPQVIFEDGFESAGGGFLNWTSGNPENGKWTADSSSKSGSKAARVKGNNDINKTLNKDISTLGYNDVEVSFWYKTEVNESGGKFEKDTSGRDDFYVEWWNGTSWSSLMHLIGPEIVSWTEKTFPLPTGAGNNPNFKLRFKVNLTAATENIYIDDVKITGKKIPVDVCPNRDGVQEVMPSGFHKNSSGNCVEIPKIENTCLLPGVVSQLVIIGSGPAEEPTLQKILNDNYGNGVFNSSSDQKNYSEWNVGLNVAKTELEATFLGKNALYPAVFGYYKNNNISTFVPLWNIGSNSDYPLVPSVSVGGSVTADITNATSVGFALMVKDSANPSRVFATNPALNSPNLSARKAISYNTASNEYIIGFEDHNDNDFNDMVVKIKIKKCDIAVCNPEMNLIKNGNFENPVVNNSAMWDVFPSGTPGLEWLVSWFGGSNTFESSPRPAVAPLELHRGVNGWLTSGTGNNQYAELDSDWFGPSGTLNNEPASVAIWQNIPTIPGKNYRLSFDFSPRPGTDATQNVLGVLWGGGAVGTPISGAGGNNTSWKTHTFNLTATTSLTSLMFRDEGTPDSLGTFLDNVSLYCEDKPVDPCTYGTQVFYSDTDHKVGVNNAVETWSGHTGWLGGVPTTSPAKWIWKDAQVQNPTGDEMYTFTKTFNLNGNAFGNATLSFAGDNSYRIVVNGKEIASTTDEFNFSSFTNYTIPASNLVFGQNTIEITVHNWALENGTFQTNPAGFIYALYVNTKKCPNDEPQKPKELQVKIYKYLDGKMATSESAGGYSFPMQSSWSWGTNQGTGTFYTLGPNGFNSTLPYTAFTSVMTAPAIYNTNEVTTTMDSKSKVLPIGAQCQNGMFRLVGYRVGDSLEDAKEADLQTANPSLTNLHKDAYIIVENETCPNLSDVRICKFDQNEKPLSGWTLMLLGDRKQDNLKVPSNNPNGVSSVNLSANKSYVAIASGVWSNQGGANLVDAEYSTINNWKTWIDGFTGFQTDILELQINSIFDPLSNWGAYNSNHIYAQSFVQPVNGPANFRIFDGTGTAQNESWFDDNSGDLNVDIYEGFAGITGENGCVDFRNVPFGDYKIDEIMKDGWKNISGLEKVKIDNKLDDFVVENSSGDDEVYGCMDKSASNYNPIATKDDGSCKYDTQIQTSGNTTNNPQNGRRRNITTPLTYIPQVLGVATEEELLCEPYLKEYIRLGANNNPDEVRKLQTFLNLFFEVNNPVTGFYGPITFNMVKKFQEHQKDGILSPWANAGMPTGPTGFVFKTTKRWINILKCPEMVKTPVPPLAPLSR